MEPGPNGFWIAWPGNLVRLSSATRQSGVCRIARDPKRARYSRRRLPGIAVAKDAQHVVPSEHQRPRQLVSEPEIGEFLDEPPPEFVESN